MKRSTIIAITALVIIQLSHSAFSQTNVGGTLSSNSTWSSSNSPYILTSTVGVAPGVTLTIEPGVEIQGNYDLLIKGIVSAAGSEIDSITFSQTRLIFKSTNLTNSSLEYLRFINSSGVQLADESEFSQDNPKNSGVLTVDRSKFHSNTYARTKGYQSTAKLRLTNCVFTSSTIKGFYPRTEIIEIVSSIITSSTINSDSYNNGIHLFDSQVNNSSFTIGCCGSNFRIENSAISNSTFSDYNNYHTTTITNSNLTNTTFALTSGHLKIEGSELFAPSNGTTHIQAETIEISSSELTGNNTNQAIIINGNQGVNGRNSSIRDCTFDGYANAVKVDRFNNFEFTENNFVNISNFILENKWSSNLDARRNYWGTTDESIISSKILDGNNDLNYGFVDFSDYLSVPTYVNSPPSDFALTYPGDGSAITYDDILFQWEESINNTPIEYSLFINNQSVSESVAEITEESHTFIVENVLLPNTGYSWFVMAIDDADTTVSDTLTFTLNNVPPSSFSLSSPSDNETIQFEPFDFIWEPSVDYESLTYEVVIYNYDNIKSLNASEVNSLSIEVDDLLTPNLEYSWYVIAADNYDSTYSDTLIFTTGNIPPRAFDLISPLDSTAFAMEEEITVVWENSEDLESVRYDLEIYDDELAYTVKGIDQNYYRIDTLEIFSEEKDYKILLMAMDDYDTTFLDPVTISLKPFIYYDTLTTQVYDTTFIDEVVYDTMFIEEIVYDTMFIEEIVYDTMFIEEIVYDTMFIEEIVYDTMFIEETVYDTTFIEEIVYDTTYVVEVEYDTIYISEVLGVEYRSDISDLTIYPNPTTDGIIEVQTDNSIKKVIIYDLSGIKIDEFDFENNIIKLNSSPGVYFIFFDIVNAENQEKNVIKKVIFK